MTTDDQDQAARLDAARAVVNRAGAENLARRPWQHPRQPSSDVDLVRFAVWASGATGVDQSVAEAGLRLLATARAELDQVESGLLFAARGAGMTWLQIAEALGLGSPQAAQQRLGRVATRTNDVDSED